MPFSFALNAAIAIADGRLQDAKSILRDPALGSEVRSIPEVVGRLSEALDRHSDTRLAGELRVILQRSLRLDHDGSEEERAAYLKGVAAVEALVEGALELAETRTAQ